MSSDKDCSSPQDSQPTSPGFQTDAARNVAVDYIKARYEGGAKPKDTTAAAAVPKVFREPKKLDFQWDKIVDETSKKEVGLPVGFKEQDLLQMVFTCMGVDTKSQYLSAIETQQSASKDERAVAEIESLPEITKSVRQMFETGNVMSPTEKSASEKPEEIQCGTAKSLLNQWTRIGTDGSSTTSGPPGLKPTYELAPGSGVFENEPAVLDGVVRSTDQADEQVIQRGMTRSLLGQWSNIGSSQTPARNGPIRVKPTYESAPGSGVFENEPSRLEGVVRENDGPSEGEQIQRGFTKSLLNQWQNKNSTETKYPARRPIKLAEAEGRIAENEPVRRTDVVREDDAMPCEGEQVRKGMAKSLANEWKTKGNEEFVVERKAINVAEAEGKVLESEPIRRTDVVREDDPANDEGEQIQRGTTRMLLDQWKNIGSNSRQYSSKERTPIVVAEAEGKVVENEPAARRTDVAREDDPGSAENEQIQRGLTRSLMSQWRNMGSADTNDYRKERTPINVNDAEGKVVENEPVRRTDVVRADDESFEEVKIQRGTTRNLLSQWKNKSNEEFRSVRRSIVLDEDEGRIAENEPEARRSDVVREDMAEGEQIERGIAKNRLNEWRNKATEEFRAERKPIVLAEGEGYVAENEPSRRTDVVREEDDIVNDNQVQRGLTKSLLSQWKNMGTEDQYKQPKRTILVAEGEECVAENEPIRRTDVVHADDVAPGDELQVQKGTTKSLLNQWKTKGTEDVRTERKPIVVAEDEGRVLESEPVRLEGVVRADDVADEGVVHRGTTKSLLEQWKNKPNEESKIERRPIVLAEAEGTVAENDPVAQRQDVVRASDYVPDERVVERGFARNLRQQWANKGSEEFRHEKTPIVLYEAEGRIAENEPIRRTDVVRADDADGAVEDPPIQRGTTRSLLNRWSSANLDSELKTETRKPIVVAEDDGRVAESEPVRRGDVVRADDPADEGEVLVRRGMAKNLANQWKNKGSEEFVVERKAINVCDGEGTVAENEPIRRADVVREEDDFLQEQEQIQKGLTKSLLGQWKKMGTEEVKVEKKPIILAEAEGKVLESEPVRRDDVVHCDDVDTSGEIVSKGITKSLLNQWVNKSSEEFVVERKKINVAEGEGTVAENEPVIRTDVIREDGESDVTNIQRGLAKSLVTQWKHKGEEEYTVEKKPIVLAEAEGTVAENEPVVRSDLIRENDSLEDTKIQRGIAKSLANQWKHKGQEEFKIERAPIVVAEGDGTIAESEPVRREDVIRADDVYSEGETIQRGTTKNLLTQWKSKGSEEFKPQRKSIIIAEGEGTVAENEPVRRQDVAREDDSLFQSTVELPQRGQTRQLRAQWMSMEVASSSPSNLSRDITPKPMINIYEEAAASTGNVAENQPAPRRADVVREDDDTPGDADAILRRGHARDMVGYWMTPKDDGQPSMTRDRMELEALRQSGMWASGTDVEGAVFENEPVRLEGVIRAGDAVEDKSLIERGTARQLASSWLNRRDEVDSRQPFRLELDVDQNAVSVYENEPAQLEGVVRSSEPVREVLGQHGQIRNIRQLYVVASSDDGTPKKPPEMVKIDLAEGPSVIENVPATVDPSIVRADDYEPDQLKAGMTRDLRERWLSQRDLEGATGAGAGFGGKPAWQIELEMTPAGSGVFENEPLVRTDVIREEDRDPDMIPVRQTRKTRALWCRREREEIEGPQRVVDTRTREMIRFTPPRERTPPVLGMEEPYKSVQRITFQSSGSSTPARDQTPARSTTSSQQGGRGSHSATVQSPHQSQPGTPGHTASSQMSWTPSPAEAAKARAQISSEVMQWHARRMSRSLSTDDNQSTSATSQPTTPSIDPGQGDWMYQQQPQQQPPQRQRDQAQQQSYFQHQGQTDTEQHHNGQQVYQYSLANPQTNHCNDNTAFGSDSSDYLFSYQQQPQPQYQDVGQWSSYETANPDFCQYNAIYSTQPDSLASPSSEDVQKPVTVRSSATLVFKSTSNGH